MFSVILISCSGTTPIVLENVCPSVPKLLVIGDILAQQTPPEVIEIVTENYIRLAEYSEKLRVRANCE